MAEIGRTDLPRTLGEWGEHLLAAVKAGADIERIEELARWAATDSYLSLSALRVGLQDQRIRRSVIFRDRELQLSACLFYWPPGYHSPRHEHREWTVSAVMSGELEVRLYEHAEAPEASQTIRALRGDVGGVTEPPGIHSVGNPSRDRPAVSVSLFAPRTGKDTTWLGPDVRPALLDGPEMKLLATELAALEVESTPFQVDVLDSVAAMRRRLSQNVGPNTTNKRKAVMAKQQKQVVMEFGSVEHHRKANMHAGRNLDSKRTQKMLAASEGFEMEAVIDRYRRDYDIKKKDAQLHEREIKRYLTLAALHPDRPLGMAGPIDKLWHTFLLFTLDYHRFCNQVAGYYIHHQPTLVKGKPSKDDGKSYVFFFESYHRVFGEFPPTDAWPQVGTPAADALICLISDACLPCTEPVCESEPEPVCESPNCETEPVCESEPAD